MKTSCWIVVGCNSGLKLRKSKGSMTMNEVAVRLQLDILMACEERKRVCYTIELDPDFCSHGIERWENATGLKAVKQHE